MLACNALRTECVPKWATSAHTDGQRVVRASQCRTHRRTRQLARQSQTRRLQRAQVRPSWEAALARPLPLWLQPAITANWPSWLKMRVCAVLRGLQTQKFCSISTNCPCQKGLAANLGKKDSSLERKLPVSFQRSANEETKFAGRAANWP